MDDIKAKLDDYSAKFISGEITVPDAFQVVATGSVTANVAVSRQVEVRGRVTR